MNICKIAMTATVGMYMYFKSQFTSPAFHVSKQWFDYSNFDASPEETARLESGNYIFRKCITSENGVRKCEIVSDDSTKQNI